MKNKFVLFVLVFIPLASICAIVSGMVLQLQYLWIGGLVTLIVYAVIFSAVRLHKLIKTAKRIVDEEEGDVRFTEAVLKSNVNSSIAVKNKESFAIRWFVTIIKTFRSSNLAEKLKSFALVALILGLMISFAVLITLDLDIWALAIWGICAVVIISTMVISNIIQKRALAKNNKASYKDEENYIETTGVVKACNLFSETYYRKSTKEQLYRQKAIASTTYKIKLDVNGEEKVAYSHNCYNNGETVKVLCQDGSSLAVIFDEDK